MMIPVCEWKHKVLASDVENLKISGNWSKWSTPLKATVSSHSELVKVDKQAQTC